MDTNLLENGPLEGGGAAPAQEPMPRMHLTSREIEVVRLGDVSATRALLALPSAEV